MQQAQQREAPERISWARAMIFGIGFFFIAAILIGQLPGYIYTQMTAATLEGFEQGTLALAATCLGGFIVIQVIVLLFDPKPVLPPVIFTGLGGLLSLGGLALLLWASLTGCDAKNQPACNQYFPHENTNIASLVNGKFLWFQTNSIDLIMVGAVIFGIGLAMVFYGTLAQRELRNPDRRDMGTTPAMRIMLIVATLLLVIFMIAYAYVSTAGLAQQIAPNNAFWVQKVIELVVGAILGLAIVLALGVFMLRLHYLMRPVRKRTMAPLYAFGALGLAQLGVIFFLVWLLAYPVVAWVHTWTFIGLGNYATICARADAIPASCSFSPEFGYLIDTIVSGGFFTALVAAIVVWKSRRNLVVIGSVTTAAVLGLATLTTHMHPDEMLTALLMCGGILVLAVIWTSVSRREFAIVGEQNLGCLGMWLVLGTCLFVYLAGFAFFSIPTFREAAPNVPFISGTAIPPPSSGGNPVIPQADAMFMVIFMALLAGIQFFFLVRNRYKV